MLSRREALLAFAAAACSRATKDDAKSAATVSSASALPARVARTCDGVESVMWTTSGVSSRAVILRPKNMHNTRFPVLVALHGRGEALKGPERGALGWPDDYALTTALDRVCAPPLVADDFDGLVEPAHLDEVNASLATRPFRGLVVVCPYVPDLDLRRDAELVDYGKFVATVLLPRAVREMPALAGAASTGIDGVSLGGAVALRAGLAAPDVFGAVGALQPAIDDARAEELVDLARAARAKHPSLALRVTTSHDDYYRDVVRALDAAWTKANVAHDFAELPGPHDYVFNRGPGAYEMILWHARVLRAQS